MGLNKVTDDDFFDVSEVLTICGYVSDDRISEFQRNKSGYGYVVGDIVRGLSSSFPSAVYAFSGRHASFNYGACTVLDNRVRTTLRNMKANDILKAAGYFCRNFLYGWQALRVAYAYLTIGSISERMRNSRAMHVHGCNPNIMPYIQEGLEKKLYVFVTLHGLNSFSKQTKAKQLVRDSERRLLKLLTAFDTLKLSVLTPAAKLIIVDYIGVEFESKITVIPNFIPPRVWHNNASKKNTDKKIVLYVGNLSVQKNQKALLDVIKCNVDIYRGSVKFVFVGDFCDDFTVEREFFSDKADLVEFTEHLPRDQVFGLYAQADLVVLLSKVEGFGMSVIEGMAFGVPCLLNDKIEIASLLEDRPFIYRVEDVNCPRETKAKLDLALKNRFEASIIQSYSEKFTDEIVLNKYRDWIWRNT